MIDEIIYPWIRYWKPINVTDGQTTSNIGDATLFDDLKNKSLLILLGDPGIGKTETVKQIVAKLKSENVQCVLINLNDGINSYPDLQSEIKTQVQAILDITPEAEIHLFIDSLDEGFDPIRRIALSIISILSNEFPSVPIKLRLACRSAEWSKKLNNDVVAKWQQSNETEVTYILTELSMDDVWFSASQVENVTADAFVSEIKKRHVEALAVRPVTLSFLLNIFRRDGKLPSTRKALYEQGCQLLTEDPSYTRPDLDKSWKTSPPERYGTAKQIAALTLITNRLRIFRDKNWATVDTNSSLRMSDCYIEENDWQYPEQRIQETLQTALFTNSGSEYRIWSHLSYGEYLAASYLVEKQLLVHELMDLLINPKDPQQRIIPKLHEIAVWIATLLPSFSKWLISHEPEVLLQNGVLELPR